MESACLPDFPTFGAPIKASRTSGLAPLFVLCRMSSFITRYNDGNCNGSLNFSGMKFYLAFPLSHVTLNKNESNEVVNSLTSFIQDGKKSMFYQSYVKRLNKHILLAYFPHP